MLSMNFWKYLHCLQDFQKWDHEMLIFRWRVSFKAIKHDIWLLMQYFVMWMRKFQTLTGCWRRCREFCSQSRLGCCCCCWTLACWYISKRRMFNIFQNRDKEIYRSKNKWSILSCWIYICGRWCGRRVGRCGNCHTSINACSVPSSSWVVEATQWLLDPNRSSTLQTLVFLSTKLCQGRSPEHDCRTLTQSFEPVHERRWGSPWCGRRKLCHGSFAANWRCVSHHWQDRKLC